MRDLFDEDNGGWLQDPALLEQLVLEKLSADAEVLKTEEGWKWVDAALDFPYGHTSGLRRFYGERVEFTEEELAYHDAQAEYDKLDAESAAAEDYSEKTEVRLEKLGNELDALSNRPYVFDRQEIARGGAFISLGVNGELKTERGFVRPEDEPVVETDDGEADDRDDNGKSGDDVVAGRSTSGVSINGKPAGTEEPEEDGGNIRPLSDGIIEDLTATRTVTLRNALANDPVMAFIAALHVFVRKTFHGYWSDSCLETTPQRTTF